ncbi:prolipoprotein diacylglyceryl transferase [Pseudoteredinibacter isoporae]|uniref:Phosphatidylglycerol--prolipoprotein diacylglyceryl transferase n=1 Tax=Pseudoteredinibacter isoporae TaxID=570281 RepID=A0A7X0JQJ2_9GAMM|nr:prolipoprotein diacylglyceryl transferase [Pseudoteredinibacter isoporae]MBB6520449.1 phosphatidylglycerol:prolipoprotein diacylglycerol transferase [Pseudoteredinibacter isoporae]NHO86016.1 prolipoprotein diacylglyceryl transferase [Pseudoteredinibacter isoporae]NIB25533.1 prolipoprotein diacylglyceryl transferase [Pseudoteredinibacter isoporae]
MQYPDIDPVAFSLFGLKVHWYGIMYLMAFAMAWYLGMRRARRPQSPIAPDQVEDLIMFGAFGVILGGRFGYVLFYHFDKFLVDPLWLFRVWEGGMSFHGGLLGVCIAIFFYARRTKTTLLQLGDFVAPLVPLGLGFGRIGNFIGQELWGRVTDPDAPWAMYFPNDPMNPRHPSQLYQAFLEGLVLFAILFWFSRKPRPRGAVGGLFLALYGCFRFIVEFVREPDAHLQDQLWLGWVTRGQVLSLPMIIAGLLLIAWAYSMAAKEKRNGKTENSSAEEA